MASSDEKEGGGKGGLSFNKSGYTAISCGRVGRGGNAHFHSFSIHACQRTNRPTNGRTDGRTKPLIELFVRN